MITDETRKKWNDYIQYCIEYNHKLSDRENEFIDSIEIWRNKKKDLTRKQSK